MLPDAASEHHAILPSSVLSESSFPHVCPAMHPLQAGGASVRAAPSSLWRAGALSQSTFSSLPNLLHSALSRLPRLCSFAGHWRSRGGRLTAESREIICKRYRAWRGTCPGTDVTSGWKPGTCTRQTVSWRSCREVSHIKSERKFCCKTKT